MSAAETPDQSPPRRGAKGNLVATVSDALRRTIQSGEVPVGGRIPSTAELTEHFGVSRTVVREAIASLQADGLVESRQGAGVYVLTARPNTVFPFTVVDPSRVSNVIELLEIRTALEVESAGLASLRRSPAQEEAIMEAYRAIDALIEVGHSTSKADIDFHLVIADATNNQRFREFLELMGQRLIPRRILQADGASEGVSTDYLRQIQDEHRAIAEAISRQDEDAARQAMRTHLRGSQSRYRRLLWQSKS